MNYVYISVLRVVFIKWRRSSSADVKMYRVRQKSSPLKFFAVFSATAWNFNMEFYGFIYVLHLTAKWNMILSKNDEIIDFWTWPPTDFLALKMFKLKMLFNFQKPVTTLLPITSQWRFDKQ